MAKMTNEAQEQLLQYIKNTDPINTKPSNFLEDPKFVERKTDLNFVKNIEENLSLTNLAISNIISWKDFIVVICNDDKSKGAIGVFNTEEELLYAFNQVENLTILENLKEFKESYITRDGHIVGLSKDENGHIYFFQFTLFLLDLQDYIDNKELMIFFSAEFRIDEEITKDEKGEDLDVKLGNKEFATYEKIGFNDDSYEQFTYAFALWSRDNKKIEVIKFNTLEGAEINGIRDVNFEINEPVVLSQGQDIPGADFSGISNLGIQTGDQNIDKNKTSKGSIMFSTEEDDGQDRLIPHNNSLLLPPKQFSRRRWGNWVGHPFEYLNISNDFGDVKIALDGIFETIKKIESSDPTDLSYHSTFNFIDNFTKEKYETLIPMSDLDAIRESVSSHFFQNISLVYSDIKGEGNGYLNVRLLITYYIEVENKNGNKTRININPIADAGNKDIYWEKFWQDNLKLTKIKLGYIGLQPDLLYEFNTNFTLSIRTEINFFRNQQVIKKNTSSQILIDKPDDSNKLVYEILESENNSYNGNAPIFIAPLKAFIPLKNKSDNQYHVYEFDGRRSQNVVLTNRFYNEVSKSDGDLVINLIKPESITKVIVNNAGYDKYTFDKNAGTVTLTELKVNDQVNLEYETYISTPTKINLENSTSSNDFFIGKIANQGELNTTLPTIFGAGDDIENSENFGLILYNQNKNYDAIAENVQENETMKVKHVIGYRQKDIVWIIAFNEDYSEYAKWMIIYPEGKDPYTYLPYQNTYDELKVDRLNIRKGADIKDSVFDRKPIDISTSDNITVATSEAGETDLNSPNDKVVIFGKTNQALIEVDKSIEKTRQEIKYINVNLETQWLDEQVNGTFIKRDEMSNELAKMFNPTANENRDKIHFDKLKLLDETGATLREIDISSGDFLKVITNETTGEKHLQIDLWIYREKGTNPAKRIEFTNKAGQLLIEDELIECDEGKLLHYTRNIVVESQ